MRYNQTDELTKQAYATFLATDMHSLYLIYECQHLRRNPDQVVIQFIRTIINIQQWFFTDKYHITDAKYKCVSAAELCICYSCTIDEQILEFFAVSII